MRLQVQDVRCRDCGYAFLKFVPGSNSAERLSGRLVGMYLHEASRIAARCEYRPIGCLAVPGTLVGDVQPSFTESGASGKFKDLRPEVLIEPERASYIACLRIGQQSKLLVQPQPPWLELVIDSDVVGQLALARRTAPVALPHVLNEGRAEPALRHLTCHGVSIYRLLSIKPGIC